MRKKKLVGKFFIIISKTLEYNTFCFRISITKNDYNILIKYPFNCKFKTNKDANFHILRWNYVNNENFDYENHIFNWNGLCYCSDTGVWCGFSTYGLSKLQDKIWDKWDEIERRNKVNLFNNVPKKICNIKIVCN